MVGCQTRASSAAALEDGLGLRCSGVLGARLVSVLDRMNSGLLLRRLNLQTSRSGLHLDALRPPLQPRASQGRDGTSSAHSPAASHWWASSQQQVLRLFCWSSSRWRFDSCRLSNIYFPASNKTPRFDLELRQPRLPRRSGVWSLGPNQVPTLYTSTFHEDIIPFTSCLGRIAVALVGS